MTAAEIDARNKSNVTFTSSQIHSLEEITAGIQKFKDRVTNNSADWPLWEKIKDWFHDHTGTRLFEGCPYSNPCGPCPGLCLGGRFGPTLIDEEYELSQSEIDSGIRRFTLSLDDEESKLLFGFKDEGFVYEGDFYLPNDIDMSDSLAAFYHKTKITLKAGIYPVYYGDEPYGETLVDVEIED
jgi:hypothetical protein